MGQGPAIAIWSAALFALASVAGCLSNGGPNNLGTVSCAAPAGQSITPDVVSPCQVSIDFGEVAAGVQVSAAIQVQNAGASPLTFGALSGNLDPAFTIDTSALQQPLPPGGTITLALFYKPANAGTDSSSVTIPTNAAGGSGVSFQFAGQSFTAGLSVSPTSVDFGEILVGTRVNKTVTLTNTSSIDIDGITASVTGDPGDFTIDGSPTALKKGSSAQVGLTYAPFAAGPSGGNAVFAFADATANVGLGGVASSATLTVTPSSIDFGFVPLNTSPLGCTTVANPSTVVQVVTGVAGLMIASFAVASTDDATPPNPIAFPLTIPAGGSAKVCFTFGPTVTQQYLGQATLTNSDANGTNPVVQLTGWGGGPQITCNPPSLDFGDIVAGASVTQVVTCTNTGTAITTTNLTLGQPSASPGAFSAQFDPGDPYSAAGIVAGQNVEIDVTYAPVVGSPTTGMLSIPNNGGEGATVEIPLTVDQVFPTACEFAILPPSLDFGNVNYGHPVDLAFDVQNQGTVPCFVANLAIQNNTSGDFGILSTSIARDPDAGTIAIPAPADGATSDLIVRVRFQPQSGGSFSAEVAFSVQNALTQGQEVDLSGSSQSTCLVVAPTNLDFGTVALGDAGTCDSSAELEFTVFNQCTSNASLESLTLQPGPGDAAAQFSAPAGSPVPYPLYPGSVNAANQVSFALSFEPRSAGFHTGQILVSDGKVSTPIFLSGTAASEAIQTDNFVAALPKADVLFILDVSGSNGLLELMLDGGLAAFVQDGAQIDYRFAVTTDNDDAQDATAEFGRLLPCQGCSVTGNAPEIIGPTTIPEGGTSADPATALGDLLASIPGSALPSGDRDFFQGLLLALDRAPIAGVDFFRPGAYFAAVSVASTDSGDDTSLLTWYQDFFEAEFVPSMLFSWNYAGQGTSDGTGLLGASEQPTRIRSMVSGTGGVAVNAKDPNWPAALSGIWTAEASASASYTLSAMPLNGQSGITVTRNGSTIPRAGGGGPNWTYDSFTNSVTFNALLDPPAVGDQISVSYPVGCQ